MVSDYLLDNFNFPACFSFPCFLTPPPSPHPPVIVKAYADAVQVTVTQPPFNTYTEDDESPIESWSPDGIPLVIDVEASVDQLDESEYLSVSITIPFDDRYNGAIGELNVVGTFPDIVFTNLGTNDDGELVYSIMADTTTQLTAADQASTLNEFFAENDGGLYFIPAEGWSGNLTGFEEGIQVVLTTTEKETSSAEVALQSANATDWIGIDILPRADEPDITIKGNAIGLEDSL